MAIGSFSIDPGFTQGGTRKTGTIAPSLIQKQATPKVRVSADDTTPVLDSGRIFDRFKAAANGNSELEKALTNRAFIDWFAKNDASRYLDELNDWDIGNFYKQFMRSSNGVQANAWNDFTRNFGSRAASFR